MLICSFEPRVEYARLTFLLPCLSMSRVLDCGGNHKNVLQIGHQSPFSTPNCSLWHCYDDH